MTNTNPYPSVPTNHAANTNPEEVPTQLETTPQTPSRTFRSPHNTSAASLARFAAITRALENSPPSTPTRTRVANASISEVVAAPTSTHVTNAGISGVIASLNSLAISTPVLKVYIIPRPEELKPMTSLKYYIVTKGEDVGIFDDVKIQGPLINNVIDSAIWEGAESWAQALKIYTIAFNDGTVAKIPISGGRYDTPCCILPSTTGKDAIGYLNIPRQLPRNTYIPAPDEIPYPNVNKKFYTVLRGEEVGVFGIWHEVAVRTRFMGARHEKFDTWQAAINRYTIAYNNRELRALGQPSMGEEIVLHVRNVHDV